MAARMDAEARHDQTRLAWLLPSGLALGSQTSRVYQLALIPWLTAMKATSRLPDSRRWIVRLFASNERVVYERPAIVLHDISQLLNTQLDKETLATCVNMIEAGVNPEALAVSLAL